MITSGLHGSTEDSPNAPMLTGTVPKRVKRESMHDVVVNGTKVVAQVFTGSTSQCSHILLIPLSPHWPLLLPQP